MKNLAYSLSRPENQLAQAFLALFAATILVGLALWDASAAVNLLKFEARWQNDGSILVVWETSSEMDSSAFFIYRAESPNGPWGDYLDFEPAAGDELAGAAYSFVDEQVSRNGTYFYRLEEVAADDRSSFYGPIVPTEGPTSSATNTRTATSQSGLQSAPTATLQYTNTPRAAGIGISPILPTQTQPPAQSQAPLQPAPTRSLSALVTTPTPAGGVAPTIEPVPPTSAVTATPESGQIQPTASPTVTETPTRQAAPETLGSSPTAQRLAATPKETSQPLLDASAAQFTPAPSAEAPPGNAPNSHLALLLGGGALMAAALLGALALLIWRLRAR